MNGTAVYVQFDNTGRSNIGDKTLYVKLATTPGVNADASTNTFTPETAGPVAQTGANPTSLAVNDNTGAHRLEPIIPISTANVKVKVHEREGGFCEREKERGFPALFSPLCPCCKARPASWCNTLSLD